MGAGGIGSQGGNGGASANWGWPCGHAGGGGGGMGGNGVNGVNNGGGAGGIGTVINEIFRDPAGTTIAIGNSTWFGDSNWYIGGGGGGRADCGGSGAGGLGNRPGGDATPNSSKWAEVTGGGASVHCYNDSHSQHNSYPGQGLMYIAVPHEHVGV